MDSLLRSIALTLIVLALIFTSACSQQGVPHQTPASVGTPAVTITKTPIETPTPEEHILQPGKSYTVRVVHVVDGDTVVVLFPNGREERVRILGIDCPETEAERNKPGEYDGIADLHYLAAWGRKAEEKARELLENRRVTIQTDEKADLRDVYGRLLAYVYVDGEDFGAIMIKEGYARCYCEAEFSKRELYEKLEEKAKKEKIGLWNYSPPRVEIEDVHYDACGKVDDRKCLNDEYVVIVNSGNSPVSLSGWVIKDESGRYYVFPDVVLDPGEKIVLHTGFGRDNSTDLFWNSGRPIWNNDHDTAYLYDAEGELVDSYSW